MQIILNLHINEKLCIGNTEKFQRSSVNGQVGARSNAGIFLKSSGTVGGPAPARCWVVALDSFLDSGSLILKDSTIGRLYLFTFVNWYLKCLDFWKRTLDCFWLFFIDVTDKGKIKLWVDNSVFQNSYFKALKKYKNTALI